MSLEDKMEVDNRSIYVGNVSKTIFYIYLYIFYFIKEYYKLIFTFYIKG